MPLDVTEDPLGSRNTIFRRIMVLESTLGKVSLVSMSFKVINNTQ
jgi:hypothetical protein